MGFHFTGGALFIATRRRATGECPYAVCKKSVILSRQAKNPAQNRKKGTVPFLRDFCLGLFHTE